MKSQHDSKYDKTAEGIFLEIFLQFKRLSAIKKVGLARERNFPCIFYDNIFTVSYTLYDSKNWCWQRLYVQPVCKANAVEQSKNVNQSFCACKLYSIVCRCFIVRDEVVTYFITSESVLFRNWLVLFCPFLWGSANWERRGGRALYCCHLVWKLRVTISG